MTKSKITITPDDDQKQINTTCTNSWKDISTELRRHYDFNGYVVTIENPIRLHVSSSGGHRIVDSDGNGHYVPAGWVHIKWENRPGIENPVVA